MNKGIKTVYSFTIGAIISVLFVIGSTIYAELYKPFKEFLAVTFIHHWIGKSIIAAILFVSLGIILDMYLKKIKPENLVTAIKGLIIVSVSGFFVILGFYIYEGLFA